MHNILNLQILDSSSLTVSLAHIPITIETEIVSSLLK